MDKVKELETSLSHTVSINDRKNIVISGIKKIDSFDNEEFLMESTLGYIIIKGEGLEIIKLDTFSGNVSIKGKVNSLNYIDEKSKKEKEEGIIGRLFK